MELGRVVPFFCWQYLKQVLLFLLHIKLTIFHFSARVQRIKYVKKPVHMSNLIFYWLALLFYVLFLLCDMIFVFSSSS